MKVLGSYSFLLMQVDKKKKKEGHAKRRYRKGVSECGHKNVFVGFYLKAAKVIVILNFSVTYSSSNLVLFPQGRI